MTSSTDPPAKTARKGDDGSLYETRLKRSSGSNPGDINKRDIVG